MRSGLSSICPGFPSLAASSFSKTCSESISFLDNGNRIDMHKLKGNKQRIVRVGTKAQKALWQYVNLYHRGETKSLFTDPSGVSLGVGGVEVDGKEIR